ncbi:MAG: PilZ domain-containing protein [Planctomycetota bacterium]
MDNDAIHNPSGTQRPERRRDDRYTAEDAMTALGAMIDISRSGMSVLAEKPPPITPGDRFRIEVRYDERTALFPAELVYADRNAARLLLEDDEQSVKLGLKFGTLTPAQQREVQSIIDRGVKVPYLEIAWDMASVQSDPEDESGSAAPEDAIEAVGALRDQADSLAAMTQPEATNDIQADTGTDDDHDGGPSWTRTLGMLNPEPRPAQPGEVNQRRAGRIVAEDAACSLGKIVDMSAGGVCVQRKGAAPVRVGSTFMLDLQIAGRILRAPVEVMRIQKIGWRTFEYGLKFGDWPDDVRAEFGRLVRMTAKATNF